MEVEAALALARHSRALRRWCAKSASRRGSSSSVGVAPAGARFVGYRSVALEHAVHSLTVSVRLGPHPSRSRFPLGERLWHKNGVKSPSKARRAPPPLERAALQELALRYVGKYATTRAKLRAYLSRKLRERGWDGAREPDLEALAERFAELGYVDDAAYALSKSRSLTAPRLWQAAACRAAAASPGSSEEDSRGSARCCRRSGRRGGAALRRAAANRTVRRPRRPIARQREKCDRGDGPRGTRFRARTRDCRRSTRAQTSISINLCESLRLRHARKVGLPTQSPMLMGRHGAYSFATGRRGQSTTQWSRTRARVRPRWSPSPGA